MQGGGGISGNKISKIRTFAQDAALLRTQAPHESVSVPQQQTPVSRASVPQRSQVPQVTTAAHTHKAAASQNEKTPSENHAPQQIPRMHASRKILNLEEETQQIGSKHHSDSILSDSSTSFEMGENSGTIIRDTKRKRFRLFPAIVQATTDWFAQTRSAYLAYKHPYESITRSEARKEIITAAVAKSAQAPREDFSAIVRKKKGEERTPVTSTLIIKEKASVLKPQWSYTGASNTAPEQTRSTSDIAETKMVPAHTLQPDPVAKAPAEPVTVVEELPQQPQISEETTVQEDPIAPATTEVREAVEDYAVTEEEPEHAHTLPIEEPRESKPLTVEPYRYKAPPQNASIAFPRFALIGVIAVATLSGVGLSLYLFTDKDAPQEIAEVYEIPSLIRANAQIPVGLSTQRELFLQDLASITMQNSGVSQIYPSLVEASGERPASSQEILSVLALRAPGSFTRSIREMTFGAVQSEPYIVMKATSFDVAFAGMLEWENTMSADLAPLFGTPVTESFDPSARTDTQVRSAFFKDTIASNKSVRLLFDENGEDRIVYTFIDQNTILLTTTREVLDILIPLAD